jgi:hypothetical protein
MTTAVLISGQMRTADRCAAGIRQLYPDATFVVHAVQDADSDKAFLFRPAVAVIEPQHEMRERREYSWQIRNGCHGVQRVLKQLWGLLRTWCVFEASGIQADVIVRCRPDLAFAKEPEPFEGQGIRVPKFSNFWGLNDRFAYGERAAMQAYFTRLNRLDEYIDAGGAFHPESFLAWAMQGFVVRRTQALFATVRPDGSLDHPYVDVSMGDEPFL